MPKTKNSIVSKVKLLLILLVAFFILYISATFIFMPSLSRYPNLGSCFTTTVHKILLCSKSSNYTKLDHISKYFIHSTLISEDDSFYLHKGVDWNEFKKSFEKNLKVMKFARGGSTITQQLVKNAYLSQSKSVFRKFKEMLLAQQIEEKYAKSVILEKYLNVIELGTDIYGVKSASRRFFNKSPSQLNLLEAVYLTTLLPNPKLYSKSIYSGKLPSWQSQRIETLLHRLLKRRRISEDLYNIAKANIHNFPWKGVDLIETREIEDDNLDFLNNFEELRQNYNSPRDFEPGTDRDNSFPSSPTKAESFEDTNQNSDNSKESLSDETLKSANDSKENISNENSNSDNEVTPTSTDYPEEGDPDETL